MSCRCSWHFLTHLSPVNLFITSLFITNLFISSLFIVSSYLTFHSSQLCASVTGITEHLDTFGRNRFISWQKSVMFWIQSLCECDVLRHVKLLDSLVFSLNEHVVCLPEIWLVLMAITFGLVVQLVVCLLLVVVTLAQLIISLLMFFIFMTLLSLLPIF